MQDARHFVKSFASFLSNLPLIVQIVLIEFKHLLKSLHINKEATVCRVNHQKIDENGQA